MTTSPHPRRKTLPSWLASGAVVAVLGVVVAWSFSRCAALPDDRCWDDSVGAPRAETLSPDGCQLCICDAAGQLHCQPRGCASDAGSWIEQQQ